jgi:hypothetical protein
MADFKSVAWYSLGGNEEDHRKPGTCRIRVKSVSNGTSLTGRVL